MHRHAAIDEGSRGASRSAKISIRTTTLVRRSRPDLEDSYMRTAILGALLIALVATLPAGAARAQSPSTVTLQGQIACSECWFEADRKTKPYGGDADLKCAIRCAKGGVPGALAVTTNGQTTLYILESGKYDLGADGKNWTDHTAKVVEVTGTVRKEGDKQIVKVDSLKLVPAGA
jgi:ABC-type amino acid transport substrate-binding protein